MTWDNKTKIVATLLSIIVIIVTGAMAYGRQEQRLETVEEECKELKPVKEIIPVINNRLENIEEDIDYIIEKLDEK